MKEIRIIITSFNIYIYKFYIERTRIKVPKKNGSYFLEIQM
jgi:hypothetical protein